MANRLGGTPDEYIARFKASVAQKPIAISAEDAENARQRLYRHFGSVDSGDPNSTDNEKIDDDLARIIYNEI